MDPYFLPFLQRFIIIQIFCHFELILQEQLWPSLLHQLLTSEEEKLNFFEPFLYHTELKVQDFSQQIPETHLIQEGQL